MSIPHSEVTAQLADAVGPENLSSSPVDTIAHALDFWPRALMESRTGPWPRGPHWVVWPGAAAEVAHVLRHRSLLTTAIYAKVDRLALRDLARPWPGGAA